MLIEEENRFSAKNRFDSATFSGLALDSAHGPLREPATPQALFALTPRDLSRWFRVK
jgi:hypothetical protein